MQSIQRFELILELEKLKFNGIFVSLPVSYDSDCKVGDNPHAANQGRTPLTQSGVKPIHFNFQI